MLQAIKRFGIGLLVLLIVVIGYLLLPAKGKFSPSEFVPDSLPAWEGALAPNTLLQSATVIGKNQLAGPEELALGPDGLFYTGTADGYVKRFNIDGDVEIYAETGGRPAGLDFDQDGNLYVAVGYKGLMKITPSKEVSLLAKSIEGVDLNFVDGMRVGDDGMVYFSLASAKYSMHDWLYDFLESSPNGMLLKYDPSTEELEVLADELYFPNGIVYHPSGEYLLFNETSRFRVMRYWLEGSEVGSIEVFADNMPGLTDGLAIDPANENILVSLSGRRSDQIDGLISQPGFLRNAFLKIPPALLGELDRYALFVVLSPEGEIIKSYHDPDGSVATVVTSTLAHEDKILVGSFEDPQVLVIDK